MDFNFGNSRERVTQQVLQFNTTAPADHAVPLCSDLDQHQLITSFSVNNYSTAPNSVFIGQDRHLQSSFEIVPGAAPVFTVFQEGRQFYELQILIMQIASQTARDLIKIPVITWDLTHWYVQATGTAPITVAVMAFPLPYL